MYYDVTNGAIEEIGLAVSADGIFWARIGNQPVLPRGGAGQWDENYACEHAVVLRLAPNNFKMWYSGGVNSSHEGIGCASSSDGINWTKFAGNPVFSIYNAVAWRTGRTYNPWVLFDPLSFSGQGDFVSYKFWMTGGTDIGNPDIGYATQPVPRFSTGLIENTPVAGVRPTTTLTVKITNDDPIATASILIKGFYVTGTTKILYVLEVLTLAPGEVVRRIYYAQFDEFEFQFMTSSNAVEISAWGKNAAGNLVAAHRVLPAELNPICSR